MPELSRRRFLEWVGFLGAGGAVSLLAACVQTAPATGPTPQATAPSQPAATPPTAPAAQSSSTASATSQVAPAAVTTLPEVVIGASFPLSGPIAPTGLEEKAAVELAVEAINNPGPLAETSLVLTKGQGLPNLGGAKIRVVITDHQGDPARGAGEAERLITQEKVAAVFGMYASAVTSTASQVAERMGVPFLCSVSTSPALTTRGFKWFFRTTPHDGNFSEAMFAFMKDLQPKKGIQIHTVVLTYEDTEYGTSSGAAEKALAQQAGFQIKEDIQYRSRATSFTTELQRLKAADADVWLPSSYVSDAILFVKEAKELDFNPKLAVTQDAGFSEAAFIEQVGKDAEGYTSRAVYSPDLLQKIPALKTLNDLYHAKANRDLSDTAVREFTGFLALADAINRAGSVDHDNVRAALVATDLQTAQIPLPWKGVKFDQTGQNVSATPIIVQLQGGTYWTVWPTEFATRDLIYPIPPWSQRG